MGIVIKQSINNLIYTYIGFAIGAINTLFLYPYFLQEEYYGLINVLLSTAMIFYPLLSFGMSSALIKFYSSRKSEEEKNSLVNLSMLFPLLIVFIIGLFFNFRIDLINSWLSDDSVLLKDYTVYILILAAFIAYFEIFYSYSKVQFKSVFGNVLKEISIRVVVSILLLLVYFNIINEHLFIVILTIAYGVRTLIMALYSFAISSYRFSFAIESRWREVVVFSFFVIMSSSVTYILIELDKFMVSQFIDLSSVAYYAVGGFIGTVVAVPGRSMQQILVPIVSQALNENNIAEIEKLYKKSSINMLIVSGLIFLLIVLNTDSLYEMLPEKFALGASVAFFISLTKLIDMSCGINGAIISNSKYYKVDLLFGIILVAIAVFSNIILIPVYGLNGAAIATVISTIIFNILKLIFIRVKFGVQPFDMDNLYLVLFIIMLYVLIDYIVIHQNPVYEIIARSILILISFSAYIFVFKPSQDISDFIEGILKKMK